jgi:quaternary ammonium compound-resistance protein SugE
MQWFVLILAGLLEIGWAVGLKYTAGFTRLWPSIFTIAAIFASLGLLGIAMKSLPVGTAYAVWMGIGAAGTVVLGIFLFDEPASALRLASAALILLGVAGLKLSAP